MIVCSPTLSRLTVNVAVLATPPVSSSTAPFGPLMLRTGMSSSRMTPSADGSPSTALDGLDRHHIEHLVTFLGAVVACLDDELLCGLSRVENDAPALGQIVR